jgi:hypothetical protein
MRSSLLFGRKINQTVSKPENFCCPFPYLLEKMFERKDGVLLHFHESLKESTLRITALHVQSNKTIATDLFLFAFDKLFESIPELMNPNRKNERYEWVGERMSFEWGCSPPVMLLTESVCSPMVDLEFAVSSSLPMGKMNAYERQRFRDSVMNAETKREQNIADRENARGQREITRIKLLRFQNSEKMKSEKEEVERCTEALKSAHCDRVAQQEKAEKARADLQIKRNENISQKEKQRVDRDAKWVQTVLESKREDKVTREQSIVEWRKTRDDRISDSRTEEAMFKERMRELQQRRQDAYDQREIRWKVKEGEYLKLRADKIKAIKRKQIIMKEKKQAMAYDLFSSQPIPT